MPSPFEESHPNIASFVDGYGWIEIGRDDDSPLTCFIRAINPGGMVWEGQDSYKSLDEAFQDLEEGLGEWMRDEGFIEE